jgi:hypothetical protein
MDVIKFPGEFFTPEHRERDRWVTVAFAGAALSGLKDEETKMVFLKELLRKFADVPDQQPEVGDPNYKAYAVKMLLRALTNPDGLRQISEAWSAEMFDAVT